MNLTNAKTIDLINELASRNGVIKTEGEHADLILTIPSLDGTITETFELSLNDTTEEVINLVEIIMDRIRDGWKRVDHWMLSDDLIIVLKQPEKNDAS
ncbi:hypothetical protein B7C51_04635 [Paenibacillus larvae subsp. pulvifaciens]|uniref:Uncharacterized protein n=1 Tax=Paenibacillus larvae subsp. pulvifaciens TaxID=1477 RepID=A0A1V0UQ62_9BACL|nr:hypothetical protein [Paenibacillus larvae]ARF67261.1 hypothetical protein B7C51_04635 [Paenibacillus larvae subsp. pulvifaciens]